MSHSVLRSHCALLSLCFVLTVLRSHCASLSLRPTLTVPRSRCASPPLCLALAVPRSHCASLSLCALTGSSGPDVCLLVAVGAYDRVLRRTWQATARLPHLLHEPQAKPWVPPKAQSRVAALPPCAPCTVHVLPLNDGDSNQTVHALDGRSLPCILAQNNLLGGQVHWLARFVQPRGAL